MKKLLLTFIFSFSSIFIFAQNFQWAKSQGGIADDGARVSATDAAGNLYVGGLFFSPSITIGTLTPLTNAGSGTMDAYLAKFDPSGNALWAHRIGGAQNDDITGVTIDPNTGSIWISGSFNSSVISVPPANMSNSNSTGNFYDCYFGLFSPLGLCNGMVAFGGNGDQFATNCVFSGSQNCFYITGNYATPTMSCAPVTLTNTSSTGKFDVFLARYTTAGTNTWARTMGGINADDKSTSIGEDASGMPYVGGNFAPSLVNGPTVIGTTTLNSLGFQDMFLAKYNTSGTFQWARGIGSSGNGDNLTSLVVDGVNDICIAGSFQTGSLTVGTLSLANTGGIDAFVAKYNSLGTAQWANKVAGTFNDYAYSVDVDATNNIYLAGAFGSSVIVVGTNTLSNTTGTMAFGDAYAVKYNPSGTPIWAVNSKGNENEYNYDVSLDGVGNVYLVGQYHISGPTAFGTTTLTSAGLVDCFIAKIGCVSPIIVGASTVCAGSSISLTASGATNYTWSTGATTPSIAVTPTANTSYSIIGSTGSCTVSNPILFNVSALPASINAGPDYSLTCGQNQVISASTNPPSPSSIAWVPATNLSGAGVLSPTATGGSNINYTVTATLNNGCVVKDYLTITAYVPTPQICMVTVDSLGNNNEIYWHKPSHTLADSFIVYREVSTNQYKRLAAIHKSQQGIYIDTARSIGPNNGDPKLTAYKYKLQIRDNCGNYSTQSLFHQTMFVQDQQNGNFNWNPYTVESSTSPVANYNLKRRDLATGTETLVGTTSAALFSDPAYNSFYPLNVKWFVDAVGFNCDPAARVMSLKTRTKSNQTNERSFPQALFDNNLNTLNIKIFPNPAKDFFNVNINSKQQTTIIYIKDVLGKTIFSAELKNDENKILTNDINNGVYLINIVSNGINLKTFKLVVNH